MATIIDEAHRKLAQLAQEVAQLRNENNYLRRQTGNTDHDYHYYTAPRILRRALDDALAMLVLIMNDMPVSRQFMYELGYSERRYYWAIGLLRAARVMARLAAGASLILDFKTAEQRLQSKYESLKGEQDALEKLRLYMPRKMQYVYGSGGKVRDTMP